MQATSSPVRAGRPNRRICLVVVPTEGSRMNAIADLDRDGRRLVTRIARTGVFQRPWRIVSSSRRRQIQ